MRKLRVIATKDGRAGIPEPIGEIDADEFEHDSKSRALLGPVGTHQLIDLFGNGYGNREFHLQDGDEVLVRCRIVEHSSGCVLDFEGVEAAPEGR